MLSNMKLKSQNALRCDAYQQRKRERDEAADRRRTAARTRTQSKREAPADPAGELEAWSKKRLRVPPGHDRAGEAMVLPRFAVDFLRDALKPECHTAWLLVGRKNGKSQALACLILGYVADGGPLRLPGFRAAVVSVSKTKAAELKKLAQDTAEASGLRGLTFPRSPHLAGSYLAGEHAKFCQPRTTRATPQDSTSCWWTSRVSYLNATGRSWQV